MAPRRDALRGRGPKRVHGDVRDPRSAAFSEVYRIVRRIPRGRVMTYGQIATHLGQALSPRAVGWALHGCPGDVPWQRVVNASGGCSTERLPDTPPGLQRALLEAEGIQFRNDDTLDLELYRWRPRSPAPTARPSARRRIRSPTR